MTSPNRYTAALLAIAVALAAAPALAQTASQKIAANDAYQPPNGDYSTAANSDDAYRPADPPSRTEDVYQTAPSNNGGGYRSDDPYDSGRSSARPNSFGGSGQGRPGEGGSQGYGEPYSPPAGNEGAYPEPMSPQQAGDYNQSEVASAGHRFFGNVSKGLADAVEWAFKSQGRPNGYVLGEDAGGALVVGLRYGEGTLFTKDAGNHKVFWQGPSIGFDAGAEGSKTMILVYNMRDPNEIYERFGGVQGAAYLVGGASVQLQKYNDVTLAVIRSGVGLRLGANVGYMKYTRSPTWNPL